jgi:uncharacterized Rossmann fold enzyme
MDLGQLVGPYSKPGLVAPIPASKRKLLKLGFARRLLVWLAENSGVDVVNFTGGGEDLKGIPRLDSKSLRRIIV